MSLTGFDVDLSSRNATLDVDLAEFPVTWKTRRYLWNLEKRGRIGQATADRGPRQAVVKDAQSEAALPCGADVVHAVAAALVKATLESSAVIQSGERPVGEQDEY
jgi:hypothetical protein